MLIKCFTCRGKIRSILRNTQHLSVRLTWGGGGSLSSMKDDYICSPFQPCLPAVYKCHVRPQEFRSFKCMENTTGRKSPINSLCVWVCVCFCVCLRGLFPEETCQAYFLSRPCGNRSAVRVLLLIRSLWTLVGIVSFWSWTTLGFLHTYTSRIISHAFL